MNDEGSFLHDLSTPLATLILLTDALLTDAMKRGGPDAKQIANLEAVIVLLNRLQTLIDERKRQIR